MAISLGVYPIFRHTHMDNINMDNRNINGGLLIYNQMVNLPFMGYPMEYPMAMLVITRG